MKAVLLIVFTFIGAAVFAQRDTLRLREIQKKRRTIITTRPQAVYFLIGGSGPFLSANYDRRFGKRVSGPGFAVGVGYYSDFGINVFSIPVSLNYLLGRNPHFIEVAAGTTFATATSDLFSDERETGSLFFYHINVGYRYQPNWRGLFIRGGVSPLFGQGRYLTSYYGGVGYNF